MKLELIEKINGVNNFNLYQDQISIWYNKKLCKNGIQLFDEDISHVYYFKSFCFIIFNNFKESVLIDAINQKHYKNEHVNGLSLFINENTILYNDWNEDYTTNYLIKCNLVENKEYWRVENYFGKSVFINNQLFTSNKDFIFKVDDSTAISIWQYNLSSLGTYKNLTNETCNYEVKHFIGVYDQKLIIQLSNATFLFLDLESGEHIRTLHLNEMLELPKPVFYEDAYPAHIEENQLIWLSNQRLLKIDIDTFEASVIRDYYTAPRENQFRFMSNTYHEGKIYFVADYGWQYVTPSHVGVMDANTGDILWHEQLENTGGLSEAPQVSDDKLYVRTNNKVLNIFQRVD